MRSILLSLAAAACLAQVALATNVAIAFGSSANVTDANGNLFLSDRYFTNGVPLQNSYYNVNFTVSFPLGGNVFANARQNTVKYTIPVDTFGLYNVTLLFIEPYWSAAGQRTFDVLLQNNFVLNNFDIVATAGAKEVAVYKTFQVYVDPAARKGAFVTLETLSRVDQPIISGIQIVEAGPELLQQVKPDIVGTNVQFIDCGYYQGSPYYADDFGANWEGDFYATGGSQYPAAVNGVQPFSGSIYGDVTLGGVSTYLTSRVSTSSFSYDIPVTAGGKYTVYLLFTEYSSTATVGSNVFDIYIQDQLVYAGFDILAVAGRSRVAVHQQFLASVQPYNVPASLVVRVELRAVQGAASLAGVGIVPAGNQLVPAPVDYSKATTIPGYSNIPAKFFVDAGNAVNTSVPTFVDQSGNMWLSDLNATTPLLVSQPQTITTAINFNGIHGIASEAIFQSYVEIVNNNIAYSYPPYMVLGWYYVTLYFVEPYFTSPGQRVFNIYFDCGGYQINNFDIFKAAGNKANTAVAVTFEQHISYATFGNPDCSILRLEPVVGNPVISAFSVVKDIYA